MTTSANEQGPSAARAAPSLADRCREAIAELDRAAGQPVHELKQEVTHAERIVVRLRDDLIERLREDQPAGEAQRLRTVRDRVNAALSLVVGLESPITGIQRSSLQQVRAALQGLFEERLI